MDLNFETLPRAARYKLLTASIVPRPIALVSTLGPDGLANAAPFSFFNVFSDEPPLIMLGIDKRADGQTKHTAENIRARGEFVVNLVDEAIAGPMVRCAAELPREVSELPFAGLATAPSRMIETPRIAEAPFSFECRTYQVMTVSEARDLILGEIVSMTARDGLVDPETLRVDYGQYRPVGRLYANRYAHQDDRFEMDVPSVEPAAGES